MWAGWVALIFDGAILDHGESAWRVVFVATLGVSVYAGVSRRRGAMNLLVAVVFVIGLIRSVKYGQAEVWGPQGVWLVVIGAHLVAWASIPFTLIHDLDCQKAPTCPRRIPVQFQIRRK